ncbi:hypothetical protein Agub_g1056, partial [Astrephomene gubernaculifera]
DMQLTGLPPDIFQHPERRLLAAYRRKILCERLASAALLLLSHDTLAHLTGAAAAAAGVSPSSSSAAASGVTLLLRAQEAAGALAGVAGASLLLLNGLLAALPGRLYGDYSAAINSTVTLLHAAGQLVRLVTQPQSRRRGLLVRMMLGLAANVVGNEDPAPVAAAQLLGLLVLVSVLDGAVRRGPLLAGGVSGLARKGAAAVAAEAAAPRVGLLLATPSMSAAALPPPPDSQLPSWMAALARSAGSAAALQQQQGQCLASMPAAPAGDWLPVFCYAVIAATGVALYYCLASGRYALSYRLYRKLYLPATYGGAWIAVPLPAAEVLRVRATALAAAVAQVATPASAAEVPRPGLETAEPAAAAESEEDWEAGGEAQGGHRVRQRTRRSLSLSAVMDLVRCGGGGGGSDQTALTEAVHEAAHGSMRGRATGSTVALADPGAATSLTAAQARLAETGSVDTMWAAAVRTGSGVGGLGPAALSGGVGAPPGAAASPPARDATGVLSPRSPSHATPQAANSFTATPGWVAEPPGAPGGPLLPTHAAFGGAKVPVSPAEPTALNPSPAAVGGGEANAAAAAAAAAAAGLGSGLGSSPGGAGPAGGLEEALMRSGDPFFQSLDLDEECGSLLASALELDEADVISGKIDFPRQLSMLAGRGGAGAAAAAAAAAGRELDRLLQVLGSTGSSANTGPVLAVSPAGPTPPHYHPQQQHMHMHQQHPHPQQHPLQQYLHHGPPSRSPSELSNMASTQLSYGARTSLPSGARAWVGSSATGTGTGTHGTGSSALASVPSGGGPVGPNSGGSFNAGGGGGGGSSFLELMATAPSVFGGGGGGGPPGIFGPAAAAGAAPGNRVARLRGAPTRASSDLAAVWRQQQLQQQQQRQQWQPQQDAPQRRAPGRSPSDVSNLRQRVRTTAAAATVTTTVGGGFVPAAQHVAAAAVSSANPPLGNTLGSPSGQHPQMPPFSGAAGPTGPWTSGFVHDWVAQHPNYHPHLHHQPPQHLQQLLQPPQQQQQPYHSAAHGGAGVAARAAPPQRMPVAAGALTAPTATAAAGAVTSAAGERGAAPSRRPPSRPASRQHSPLLDSTGLALLGQDLIMIGGSSHPYLTSPAASTQVSGANALHPDAPAAHAVAARHIDYLSDAMLASELMEAVVPVTVRSVRHTQVASMGGAAALARTGPQVPPSHRQPLPRSSTNPDSLRAAAPPTPVLWRQSSGSPASPQAARYGCTAADGSGGVRPGGGGSTAGGGELPSRSPSQQQPQRTSSEEVPAARPHSQSRAPCTVPDVRTNTSASATAAAVVTTSATPHKAAAGIATGATAAAVPPAAAVDSATTSAATGPFSSGASGGGGRQYPLWSAVPASDLCWPRTSRSSSEAFAAAEQEQARAAREVAVMWTSSSMGDPSPFVNHHTSNTLSSAAAGGAGGVLQSSYGSRVPSPAAAGGLDSGGSAGRIMAAIQEVSAMTAGLALAGGSGAADVARRALLEQRRVSTRQRRLSHVLNLAGTVSPSPARSNSRSQLQLQHPTEAAAATAAVGMAAGATPAALGLAQLGPDALAGGSGGGGSSGLAAGAGGFSSIAAVTAVSAAVAAGGSVGSTPGGASTVMSFDNWATADDLAAMLLGPPPGGEPPPAVPGSSSGRRSFALRAAPAAPTTLAASRSQSLPRRPPSRPMYGHGAGDKDLATAASEATGSAMGVASQAAPRMPQRTLSGLSGVRRGGSGAGPSGLSVQAFGAGRSGTDGGGEEGHLAGMSAAAHSYSLLQSALGLELEPALQPSSSGGASESQLLMGGTFAGDGGGGRYASPSPPLRSPSVPNLGLPGQRPAAGRPQLHGGVRRTSSAGPSRLGSIASTSSTRSVATPSGPPASNAGSPSTAATSSSGQQQQLPPTGGNPSPALRLLPRSLSGGYPMLDPATAADRMGPYSGSRPAGHPGTAFHGGLVSLPEGYGHLPPMRVSQALLAAELPFSSLRGSVVGGQGGEEEEQEEGGGGGFGGPGHGLAWSKAAAPGYPAEGQLVRRPPFRRASLDEGLFKQMVTARLASPARTPRSRGRRRSTGGPLEYVPSRLSQDGKAVRAAAAAAAAAAGAPFGVRGSGGPPAVAAVVAAAGAAGALGAAGREVQRASVAGSAVTAVSQVTAASSTSLQSFADVALAGVHNYF